MALHTDSRCSTLPKPCWPKDPCVALAQKKRGKDPATRTMRRLVKDLGKAEIAYAVAGGMAVYAHGHHRLTGDVDVLLTTGGFESFKRLFVPDHYAPVAKRPRQYIDCKSGIAVRMLLVGRFPGDGRPGPLSLPDPMDVRELIDDVHYVDFVTLIQLKLSSRRHRGLADVIELIRTKGLDETFLDRIHPSVRQDFIKCLEEKRREDEYDARNG